MGEEEHSHDLRRLKCGTAALSHYYSTLYFFCFCSPPLLCKSPIITFPRFVWMLSLAKGGEVYVLLDRARTTWGEFFGIRRCAGASGLVLAGGSAQILTFHE